MSGISRCYQNKFRCSHSIQGKAPRSKVENAIQPSVIESEEENFAFKLKFIVNPPYIRQERWRQQ